MMQGWRDKRKISNSMLNYISFIQADEFSVSDADFITTLLVDLYEDIAVDPHEVAKKPNEIRLDLIKFMLATPDKDLRILASRFGTRKTFKKSEKVILKLFEAMCISAISGKNGFKSTLRSEKLEALGSLNDVSGLLTGTLAKLENDWSREFVGDEKNAH